MSKPILPPATPSLRQAASASAGELRKKTLSPEDLVAAPQGDELVVADAGIAAVVAQEGSGGAAAGAAPEGAQR